MLSLVKPSVCYNPNVPITMDLMSNALDLIHQSLQAPWPTTRDFQTTKLCHLSFERFQASRSTANTANVTSCFKYNLLSKLTSTNDCVVAKKLTSACYESLKL